VTHDFTYLNQLGVVDLLDRAHRGNWTGTEAHMIRALAERLEDYLDAAADYDAVNDALMEANQRAEALAEEVSELERARNEWQATAEALNGRVKELTY
jgi:predicted  nucleic acid-binding Zn-ribbon protein